MTHLQGRPSVAAMVMTYRPDASVIDRLELIRPQVDRLFVVDNGSPAQLAGPIREWLERAGGTFVANDRNMGVGVALNQGARAAIGAGADWLLTLDQDTNPPPDLVETMLDAVAGWERPGRVGICGPTTDHQRDNRCADAVAVRRRLVITSGSLLSLAAYRRGGPFREDYFIDMVEAEYAFRLARLGYDVILACRASIDHRIGEPTSHQLRGVSLSTTNHPAWRRYYLTRNRVFVWRANWRQAPAWVAFDTFGHMRDTLSMTLFETDRRRKLRHTMRGAADGLRGRSGERVRPG